MADGHDSEITGDQPPGVPGAKTKDKPRAELFVRTTLQIILAVKDCEPVTEEELKLALCAMSGIEHFLSQSLKKLIASIREGKPEARLKMQAEFEWGTIERMFKALKTPPDEWLGPASTPGTEENRAQMAWAKKVFKKATGEDL